MSTKAGTQSGAIEHKFCGRQKFEQFKESREVAEILIQEAMVRRDFGEEGVKRFWEEIGRDLKHIEEGN